MDTSGGLLFLLLVGVVLYCGVVALLWRRASRGRRLLRLSPRVSTLQEHHGRRSPKPEPDTEPDRSVAAIAAIAERWRAGLASAEGVKSSAQQVNPGADFDPGRPG
jgi:hypothetical protein